MLDSIIDRSIRTFFRYYYYRKEIYTTMNPYLSAFLKSIVLSGVSVGAMYATNKPEAAFATPIFAVVMKYIQDNWK